MLEKEEILRVINIWKTFGKVIALKGVSFSLNKGEIMGLLGDNGAGKSTLAKIIMGVFPPDKGEIIYLGKRVNWSSPRDARAAGIEMVFQELALIDLMNIPRNFFLAKEYTKKMIKLFRFLDLKKMNEDALKTISEIGVNIKNPAVRVAALSGGEKQSVAIGRAIYFGAKLLLLDEPTANLSIKEAHKVLDMIKNLKEKGVSIIFITHNIHHVYEVADKFLVLDRGSKIAEYYKKDVTPEDIIETIRSGISIFKK